MGSVIHGGKDMETTEVFLARWLDKEDMVPIYKGILLSHEKRWNTAISGNMDRPWQYHAKRHKSERKS